MMSLECRLEMSSVISTGHESLMNSFQFVLTNVIYENRRSRGNFVNASLSGSVVDSSEEKRVDSFEFNVNTSARRRNESYFCLALD